MTSSVAYNTLLIKKKWTIGRATSENNIAKEQMLIY